MASRSGLYSDRDREWVKQTPTKACIVSCATRELRLEPEADKEDLRTAVNLFNPVLPAPNNILLHD
jgi:hypothetical protein